MRYQHQGQPGQDSGFNLVRRSLPSLTVAPGGGPFYMTLTMLPEGGVRVQTCRTDRPEGQRRVEHEIIHDRPMHVLLDAAHDAVWHANRAARRQGS